MASCPTLNEKHPGFNMFLTGLSPTKPPLSPIKLPFLRLSNAVVHVPGAGVAVGSLIKLLHGHVLGRYRLRLLLHCDLRRCRSSPKQEDLRYSEGQ